MIIRFSAMPTCTTLSYLNKQRNIAPKIFGAIIIYMYIEFIIKVSKQKKKQQSPHEQ